MAICNVGLLDGNIVQRRKHVLGAKSLSGTDCGHDFLRKGSTLGNMLEREPRLNELTAN